MRARPRGVAFRSRQRVSPMPPHDFQLPEDFPDLTLPDKTENASEPVRPTPLRPAPSPWRVGDRVLAPWEPDCLYAGRVTDIKDNQALIQFDDGDAGWVVLDRVRPLVVRQGQRA